MISNAVFFVPSLRAKRGNLDIEIAAVVVPEPVEGILPRLAGFREDRQM